jgi:lipopolysaccharide/colanic/teichoic acid biosynthesis glycosyltransferase
VTGQGSFYRRRGKRFVDLIFATVAAVLTSPLTLFAATLVRVTSGRPVIFKQERAGLEGNSFWIYKFRTMKVGTHKIDGGYPTPDMVTPVGRWLRKTSLDELPQLLNILKGDMSLVGPRPALLDQAARYTPTQWARLTVRPGVTGLAQLRHRNAAPWSVRIETDLEYIRRQNFRLDMQLLLQTIPRVLVGAGVLSGQTRADVDDLHNTPVESREFLQVGRTAG